MVLALLDSRTDRLERAAGKIGAFFDQVRRLGIPQPDRPSRKDHRCLPRTRPTSAGAESSSPAAARRSIPPAAGGVRLSDWDQGLLDELSDELDHHNIAHDALLSVYAADQSPPRCRR
jgi:hypothetical protein